MSLRTEFVQLAESRSIPFAALCRRFAISRKTGYKWLHRAQCEGLAGVCERSRRPRHSPGQLSAELAAQIVQLRRQHPAWGALKLQALLSSTDSQRRPSTSTITRVLQRAGLLDPAEASRHRPWQRFEHPQPNDLWQMDFKGHFALGAAPARRCHPLTLLDDHSRFALGLYACPNQQTATVQAKLTEIFRRYGLPVWMTMDNGAPWGASGGQSFTPLTVWLLRLGIGVSHSRPFHPQTQGKDERFHRTLQLELLNAQTFRDLAESQSAFDHWREEYNQVRPHQALGLAVPASRYHPSVRAFPETLPPLEYDLDCEVRKVQAKGQIYFRGRLFGVSKAFRGYPLGLRPTTEEEVWQIYFGPHLVGSLKWTDGEPAD